MNGLIWLSDSQKSVVTFLEALPNAGLISFRCREELIPGRERRISQYVEISGGCEPAEDWQCETCGQHDFADHIYATFYWRGGEFRKAEVNCGRRTHHKTIADAKEQMSRLVMKALARHSEGVLG